MVTQVEQVYNHLLLFGSITNKYASDEYGFHHLPGIIRDIKKQYSVQFDEEWLKGINRFGKPTRWKKYILKQPTRANNYWEGA